jgi:hypothetical protein
MAPGERLEALEARYLAAREARDRLDVARATGEPADLAALEATAAAASVEVHEALAGWSDADAATLGDEDRLALEMMRSGIDAADAYLLPVAPAVPGGPCGELEAWHAAIAEGGAPLRLRLEACYAASANALHAGDVTLTRLGILGRLGTEPDAGIRRTLFLALEPLWRVVDGDGGAGSPYRRLVRDAAPEWRAGSGSVARNAAALGVTPDEVETWALTALAAWRAAVVEPARAAGEPPVEPWDWWWRAGAAQRIVGPLPIDELEAINRGMYAALGADLDELGVRFDLAPRPGRPVVPVAFTTFGARPHRRSDGSWTTADPIVMATLVDGGLSELGELVHETGHAIHLAGIRTRPAFVDWPDSDALTEALGELLAYDLAEPAWQRRWLAGHREVPEPLAVRCQYASTVLDSAWAMFEIRMLADPDRRPRDVWTELTSVWLGIAPHPEWSWWAIRGQLVQEPGYMANYAVGAVLTTALRAAIRSARGDWLDGDLGWYPWVRDRIFRFGLERSAGEVVRRVLGRAPTADALLAGIARASRFR